jgi:MFS family permease
MEDPPMTPGAVPTGGATPVTDATAAADPTQVEAVLWPPGEVLRDITRGGLAGLVVGIVVAGLGGRIAMRLAALYVPDASGSFTENGNRIGAITLDGSLGLIVFGGLFAGLFIGVLWVVVRPWLPARLSLRVVVAVPLAIGLGSSRLIEGGSQDFAVLGHDPTAVGVLIVLLGLVGVAVVGVDEWLERRLPRISSSRDPGAAIYGGVTALGLVFLVPVAYTFLSTRWQIGAAVLVAGLATLTWWIVRQRGTTRPPDWLRAIGTVAVAAATLIGLAMTVPEVQAALGDYT